MTAMAATMSNPAKFDLPSTDIARQSMHLSKSLTEEQKLDNVVSSELLYVLRGVAVATKASDYHLGASIKWIGSVNNSNDFFSTTPKSSGFDRQCCSTASSSLQKWSQVIKEMRAAVEVEQLARLTVIVAFLRQTSRAETIATPDDLDLVWKLILTALTDKRRTELTFTVSRSAQGFLSIPLCSLVKDGNIDELFRLHVWMPDGLRGNPEFAVHSHQAFAQSWTLAGEGKDTRYKVQPVSDSSAATHAEYALSWSDGTSNNTKYKTHQVSSTIENTHKFVCAKPTGPTTHVRDDIYSIPAAKFHTTEVKPDKLHATLFFFEAHRGFVQDARVLGPVNEQSSHQIRDPGAHTAQSLVDAVNLARTREQEAWNGLR